MANKRKAYPVPLLPSPPSTDVPTSRWLDNLNRNIHNFSRDVVEIGTDYDLIANVTVQTLTADFTITPDSYNIELYSVSDITSDTTTAIKNGRHGQTIVLTSISAFIIIIKNNANTVLEADLYLSRYDTVTLRWSDVPGSWLLVSTGNMNFVNRGYIGDPGSGGYVGNSGALLTELQSWLIPADTLTYGSYIDINAGFAFAANGNVKTIRIDVAGGAIIVVLNPITAAPNNQRLIVDCKLMHWHSSGALLSVISHTSDRTVQWVEMHATFAGIDWTATSQVKFTGQGIATNDIIQYYGFFETHRI